VSEKQNTASADRLAECRLRIGLKIQGVAFDPGTTLAEVVRETEIPVSNRDVDDWIHHGYVEGPLCKATPSAIAKGSTTRDIPADAPPEVVVEEMVVVEETVVVEEESFLASEPVEATKRKRRKS